LSQSPDPVSKNDQALQITDFVIKSTGLRTKPSIEGKIHIAQNTDGKAIAFAIDDLEEVVPRIDSDGHVFLQVNFMSGKKILLTQNLIGFKPVPSRGLDLTKLPKVVTTPDLLSVVEAIEDSISMAPSEMEEVEILKRVFDSVLKGAEAVGFDITPERMWLQSLGRSSAKPSA
jgi:hypothetical protein